MQILGVNSLAAWSVGKARMSIRFSYRRGHFGALRHALGVSRESSSIDEPFMSLRFPWSGELNEKSTNIV